VIADAEGERERLFAAFMRQKARRYIEKNGADGFDRPGYRAYFTQMTEQLHPRGHVHLSGLEIGGEIVATHWGVIHNERFYSLMLAYEDCPAARYSVAHLLVEDLIQWSFAHGLKTFDLGFGHADWKLKFGARRRALMRHEEAITPLGWAYLNARRLRDRLAASQQNGVSGVPTRGAHAAIPAEAM
jgi:CelD/BcsL family acetyltransferase involved in cellulose biosynthesis